MGRVDALIQLLDFKQKRSRKGAVWLHWTILRTLQKGLAARDSGSRYQTPQQAIAVAANALNRVCTIHVLDFSTQATD